MSRRFVRPGLSALCSVFCAALLALSVEVTPAAASGAGPGGVNIGFDFNWNYNGPRGAEASFISFSNGNGANITNCTGPVTPMTQSCNFAFSYSIGGTPQQGVTSGGVYQTWTPPGIGGRICDYPSSNTAPLTLFNCFNQNSFGQIFTATASGALTAFSMQMTCLNPAGTAPTGLIAVLYQVNAGGSSIPSAPVAQTPVDLSTCPTLTSWTGHTFSGTDFASVPINFSGVNLTTGTTYAVYFAGLAPGTPPPGGPAGAAASFTVTAPASSTAGAILNFTVTARDAANNTATGYSGTIHFTSSDSNATLPADATLTNGTGTFSATLRSTGSKTITATDTVTVSITGTSNAISVSSSGMSVVLTSTASQFPFGQKVTFAAVLVGSAGPGIPTGPMQFLDGTTLLASVPVANGIAMYSTAGLPAGNHEITASYTGAVPDTIGLTVMGLASAVTVSTGPANPVYGQSVTLTARVSGSVAAPAGASGPTGQVTFTALPASASAQAVSLGTATLAGGAASLTLNNPAVGTETIVAQYSGDGAWMASGSRTALTVAPAASAASVSLSANGSQLTLAGAVTPTAPGAGTPTGSVQFVNVSTKAVVAGGNLSGGKIAVTIAAGDASMFLGAPIAVEYAGDGNFSSSASAPLPVLVNAAADLATRFAPDEIASIFGVTGLGPAGMSAWGMGGGGVAVQLPVSLAGAGVNVTDSAGAMRPAPIYGVFGATGQINFVIPGGTATGLATVTITTPGGAVTTAIDVANSAAGVFTANQTGQGPYAGQVIYADGNGGQNVVSSASMGPGSTFTPTPISLSGNGQVYLVLYGTGSRHATSVTAAINGVSVPVAYSGAQAAGGLDQINLGPLPSSLAGTGTANLIVTVDGEAANTVTVTIE